MLSLFIGFWAFVYQGYVETAGMTPTRSWPIGAVAFAVAGVVALGAIAVSRPAMRPARLAAVGLAIAAVLVLAAVASLEAGDP